MSLSSRALIAAALAAGPLSAGAASIGLAYEAAPFYYTTQPSTPAGSTTPYNERHRPEYGGDLAGVTRLLLNVDSAGRGTLCSGALLTTGRHVLTAAHCVTDSNGNPTFANGVAQLPLTPGATPYTGNLTSVEIASASVHPDWNGDYLFEGNDLAILTLVDEAPAAAPRYDIYAATDEIGRQTDKSGWGTIGVGNAVGSIGTGWRTGRNVWDMNAETFWGGNASAGILMYDFDNGLAANDAFGVYFGLAGLGLGDFEVLAAPGDSGGPTFIDGKIAGITSFGLTFTNGTDGAGVPSCASWNPDFICRLNNSFGEFGGDTRVSMFRNWIYGTIGWQPVPEPGSFLLLGVGLVALFTSRRRGAD